MTEIATPITFAQEVTDKIRQLIMNAMPEDKLQGILQAEYNKYFEPKVDRWNTSEKTDFAKLVDREIVAFMEQRVRQEVHEYLSKLVYSDMGKEQAQTILAEITPAVLKAMAQQSALQVASCFMQGLQNTMNRGF